MALSYFGFSCDPVRAAPHLVLVRIDRGFARLYGFGRIPQRDGSSLVVANGVVVTRREAPSLCLDLLRRGVKPWADPRRRRAA